MRQSGARRVAAPLEALPSLELLGNANGAGATSSGSAAALASSDASPSRRPDVLPNLTPRSGAPLGESHSAFTPRTNSSGALSSLPPLAGTSATASLRSPNGDFARALPALMPISARSASSREPMEPLSPSTFGGSSPSYAQRRRASGNTNRRLTPLEGMQGTPIVEWPLAAAPAQVQPHHVPTPAHSSPRVCLPSLPSQASLNMDPAELRPACPWMAKLEAPVPGQVDESEEDAQSLSRTVNSSTKAEAEKALQDAFLEEQRRGSSPTAAAASALRRCRTSSQESNTLEPDLPDVSLPLAPSNTLIPMMLDPLDPSEILEAAQVDFPQTTNTEDIRGAEADTEEDFFSASRRLLFSEQGSPSLSST